MNKKKKIKEKPKAKSLKSRITKLVSSLKKRKKAPPKKNSKPLIPSPEFHGGVGPEESGGFPGLKSPKSPPIRVRRFLGRRRPKMGVVSLGPTGLAPSSKGLGRIIPSGLTHGAPGKKPVKRAKKAVIKQVVTEKIRFRPDEEIKKAITQTAVEPTPPREEQYYPKEPFKPTYDTRYQELPSGYKENKIVAMARDPWWIYVYWEIADEKLSMVRHYLGDKMDRSKFILRVYDVTGISFNGRNENSSFDLDITLAALNWYINVTKSDRSYCVDVGVLTPDGEFIMLARSNVVTVPRESPSWITDEEWMIIPEDFERLYALSGGLKMGASPVGLKKLAKERLKMHLASGAISSLSSPIKRLPKQKGFWLAVNTELIVYGATEPDASVTVCNRPIKLNRDGTFSLRFALPDGKQTIPVKAVSNDKKDSRSITPVVSKHTE